MASKGKKIIGTLWRIILGVVCIFGLAIAIGGGFGYFLGSDTSPQQIAIESTSEPARPAVTTEPEHHESSPQQKIPQEQAAVETPPVAAEPVTTPTVQASSDESKQGWRQYSISMPPYAYRDKKLIALIFDDAGVSIKRTQEIIDMPVPVTLSFLPYATNLARQIKAARSKGHEIMAHIPMEALNPDEHPGPNALMTDLTDEEILQNLRSNLQAMDSYIGINNHMGSKFTADAHRMQIVLDELKKRDLIFIDSKTSNQSVAGKMALSAGLVSSSRDVFLDDDEDPAKIKEQFEHMNHIADKNGTVIAIGHPRPNTIKAFKDWLIANENSEYMIVPLTVVLLERQKKPDKNTH